MAKEKSVTKRPFQGFQTDFASSNVDIAFAASVTGAGKSYALVYAIAEPMMLDPDFRGLITRRSLGSQKSGGSFSDIFADIFGKYVSITKSDSPRVTSQSGAYCDLTYLDDRDIDKMRERAKGWQYDVIAIDELTEMSWEAFTYVQSRNRGRSKMMTGKFRAMFNPKRSHWTRKFIDWAIGIDGQVKKECVGKVRYFYVNGSKVEDVVWGDTKEEVYQHCRIDIDRKLRSNGGNFTYKDMIKSFALYIGFLAENKYTSSTNAGYIGSIAMTGGKIASSFLELNFNSDPDEDEKKPITSDAARAVFTNDPAINGDKWITVDLADYGKDNTVMVAWNGFHVYDIQLCPTMTPRDNALRVLAWAEELGIGESHIIFDGTAGRYFKDYAPQSVAFLSVAKPFGIHRYEAMTLKDECALRLCEMIRRGNFTISEDVAMRTYTHQRLKNTVTIQNEFMEECSVVNFIETVSGRKRLMNKKQMNALLGHGRSMDVFDPCNMRMLPVLHLPYGEEVHAGLYSAKQVMEEETDVVESIYDETLWC